jgi:hypothetical protein
MTLTPCEDAGFRWSHDGGDYGADCQKYTALCREPE